MSGQVPRAYALYQNYPNPFNPSTSIRFELPRASNVRLTVYNTLGQQVAELARGERAPGVYEVSYSAADLSSGLYFYRLQAGDFDATKELMVLK